MVREQSAARKLEHWTEIAEAQRKVVTSNPQMVQIMSSNKLGTVLCPQATQNRNVRVG